MRPGHSPSLETPYGWAVVAASVATIAVGSASYYVPIVSLKAIAADFDWPRAIPALAYSVTMLGSGVGGVLMGRWSDRAGMAPPLAVGIVAIALGCMASSFATGAASYLLAQGLLVGLLGNGALYGPLVANVTRWFDRRRGLAVGMVATGQTLAGAAWSPVFRLVSEEHGWRATFLYFGLFVVVTLLPLLLVFRRQAPVATPLAGRAEPGAGGTALGLPSGRVLALLCTAIVGCCVAMSLPLVHLVSHVSDLGFGLSRGAQMLSVALAGAFVSRLSWGWVSDRIGGIATLLTTSAWQAVALAALAVVDSLPGLFAVAAFFGLGYGGIVPSYAVILREAFPSRGLGQRIGTVVLFGTIGMALGSWIGGTVYDATGGYADAFAVGCAFNLMNLVIVAYLAVRWRRSGGRRLRY